MILKFQNAKANMAYQFKDNIDDVVVHHKELTDYPDGKKTERVIDYHVKNEGCSCLRVTIESVYLLNDEGKTIEKIN